MFEGLIFVSAAGLILQAYLRYPVSHSSMKSLWNALPLVKSWPQLTAYQNTTAPVMEQICNNWSG
jgi:hypothetical protein